MFRYYAWALATKGLSLMPGGGMLYYGAASVLKRRVRGSGGDFAGGSSVSELLLKAKDLTPAGGTILDIGTGLYHHDAFLLYLAGDWQVELFDIRDRAKLTYIRNYLGYLRDNVQATAAALGVNADGVQEKLDELLALPSREAIYDRCNFGLHIEPDPTKPFLPDGSVNFMLSNCVLVHVREDVLLDELLSLRRMLADDGFMFHMLGHDDHGAHHDPKMRQPSFNYMRFSDRTYRLLFDSNLGEYHNRMTKSEWLHVFARADLRVLEYDGRISERSCEAVSELPRIDARFAQFPAEELAIYYSYVLLDKGLEADPFGRSGERAHAVVETV